MKRADALEVCEVTFQVGRGKRTKLKLDQNRRNQPRDPLRPDAPEAQAFHVLTGQPGDRVVDQG